MRKFTPRWHTNREDILRVTLTRTSEGNSFWWMKTKIKEQTFIQSQESGYMWRWITVTDDQQDESSKETTEYNHSMNSSLKNEYVVHFTWRSSSKRSKNVSIRLSMVENLRIYKKTAIKNCIFWKFSQKKEKIAFTKMSITFEGIKLKIWGLRSFVELHFVILMHTLKPKIYFFKYTWYSGF